jgi:hypothetical protein
MRYEVRKPFVQEAVFKSDSVEDCRAYVREDPICHIWDTVTRWHVSREGR